MSPKERTLPKNKPKERVNAEAVEDAKPAKEPKYNWEDPAVPAGDAPPMPRWPLVLAVAAWCGWLVFLVVMMVMRLQTTAL
jgi:hypothetical protein